ncbi:MAG: GtrA family protein [Clostridia bacterium]|nr:GtrA family protein [Clostridia bacterium]
MENEEEILEEKPAAETEPAEETAVAVAEEPAVESPKKMTKLQQFLQLLVFTGFMVSAGIIQFVTTGLLSTWTGLMSEDSEYYWIAYLTGLVLSVVWSFTFNRKFTFKAANNVPLAMVLVLIYYCAFAPLSTFGANAIVNAWKDAAGEGWDKNYEMVITVSMMLINFVTEFFWDKFVVFNKKVTDKILSWFKKKEK